MIRTLDAEDLEVFEFLRIIIDAIDIDKDVSVLDAMYGVEAIHKHLRSKYYDRPQELK